MHLKMRQQFASWCKEYRKQNPDCVTKSLMRQFKKYVKKYLDTYQTAEKGVMPNKQFGESFTRILYEARMLYQISYRFGTQVALDPRIKYSKIKRLGPKLMRKMLDNIDGQLGKERDAGDLGRSRWCWCE